MFSAFQIGATFRAAGATDMPRPAGIFANQMALPVTAVHEAVMHRTPMAVHALLRAGADVHAVDSQGWTALLHAVDLGRLDMVEVLLEHSADANAVDHTRLPVIFHAVYVGRADIVQALLYAGAQVDGTDRYGMTPLIVAASRGHADIVAALLQAKARMHTGQTPLVMALVMAARHGHQDVVAMLARAGADLRWHMRMSINDAASWRVMAGAEANVNGAGEKGARVFMLAAWHGHAAPVDMDADLQPRLPAAQRNADVAAVRTLLQAPRADGNAVAADGTAAPMQAALAGNQTVVDAQGRSMPAPGMASLRS
ncbi:ankyrin repeat domain-containing protein [Comamonas endophytica]|uniref:Ankyrin repeat domain-containing protein n=1 Tax=Comamonas endophytica TaxID=2949090 RepID=A0ABY6GCJ0_9BURK|nr:MULTISPECIES: ankyrin repeat domain-containing protein [unclassified Acidovorax]MCD2513934.1 ankyrin repeat domain-containing protein [Acidovorax sp. D4N7]UYG51721.1 ankyrin repeat domain-containing protein [Acidovorax sp. 5MLIR]UYG52072.1 ankyrin repeat domain-containing protein [Acidovorax sp. 5MLIR]